MGKQTTKNYVMCSVFNSNLSVDANKHNSRQVKQTLKDLGIAFRELKYVCNDRAQDVFEVDLVHTTKLKKIIKAYGVKEIISCYWARKKDRFNAHYETVEGSTLKPAGYIKDIPSDQIGNKKYYFMHKDGTFQELSGIGGNDSE